MLKYRSSRKEVAALQQAGFVHVTGLTVTSINGDFWQIGENLDPASKGKWCTKGNVTAIVTEAGEIWVGANTDKKQLDELYFEGDFFVPFSGGESIVGEELLRRHLNPYDGFGELKCG
jgi:hypothetical protein